MLELPPLPKISQGLVIGADRLSSLAISVPAVEFTGVGQQQLCMLGCTEVLKVPYCVKLYFNSVFWHECVDHRVVHDLYLLFWI